MSLHTASDLKKVEPDISGQMDDEVVRLEDVSVSYRVPSERIGTFKEYVIRRLQGRVQHQEFLALDQVNIKIMGGEVFGIIGKNGAGKSTLLKLVSRIMKPTGGRVWVRGRVAPLLEYGAGFHPELTGRENVFLNGALLGFTRRQMEQKFDGIVDFAELWDFIESPLRTYSSGMIARLGFAIATDVEPDILIVDEVLSVGDEAFQQKSSGRMHKFQEQGVTILLVSHNMLVIQQMCDRVAWIDHGRLQIVGTPVESIHLYRESQTTNGV
ncbi:MAG: ABC transporter ATP-binding protein [Anaerolineales bacterium]|nr:ABC transporter ATP-binding protein [Anaerolineales bacterium]